MTRNPSSHVRVAILGFGAIGRRLLNRLQHEIQPHAHYAVFDRALPATTPTEQVQAFSNLSDLLAWRPHLAIECAGHDAVASVVPSLLAAGVDVLLASVGALASPALRLRLEETSRYGGARLITVSGAIGGLDVLAAAAAGGLEVVQYIGRKPPRAWRGTLAERHLDLDRLSKPMVVFEGTAAGSARDFPQNANVTAAVALAGVGFDNTRVTLIADPDVDCNIHELEAQGAFGRLEIKLSNQPLPDNPKTSLLATLSIEAELIRYFANVSAPAIC